MSRIGNKPVIITVNIQENVVTVTGKLGELRQEFSDITIKIEDNSVILSRPSEHKDHKAKHGLYRALISNMVSGVTTGWTKEFSLVGVGHRVSMKGNDLEILCGFSHPVLFKKVEEIKFEVPDQNTIIVSGIDKALVGEVAANIRAIKPPEPYKGKGIRYKDEYVRRKAGKAAVTAGA